MQLVPDGSAMRQALLGSLAGTFVFGLVMQVMDMMPMVGMLVGNPDLVVAWVVHFVIGTAFAFPLAFLLSNLPRVPVVALGAAYGVAVWVFGPLIVMPLWLGMPGMVFNLAVPTPWWSLLGHLMYGGTAGGVVWALRRREAGSGRAWPHAA